MNWLALTLVGASALAQQPQFQTHAREVFVPVSVTTKAGKPVEGLTASDFLVLSDGQAQTVRMVPQDADPLPVHAVLVIETSGASEAVIAKIKKLASVVSTYISNDMGLANPSLAAVVTVSDDVSLEQDFTSDPYILHDAFNKLSARGSAARLIDGISLACDLLATRKEPARRVIVLIAETHDQKSRMRFADAVVKAQKDDVVIYTASYSAYTTPFTQRASEIPPPPDVPGVYDPATNGLGGMNLLALTQLAKKNVSEAFAHSTGGAHEKFTTLRGLETELANLGTEIHNRYVLTFVPPETQPPGYHVLSVSVKKAGDWRIHSRAGYWSAVE